MSHFYGVLEGQAGKATRTGSKSSAFDAVAASWGGSIRVHLWHENGQDHYMVFGARWQGNGEEFTIVQGTIGKASDCNVILAGHFVPAYPGKDAVIGAVLNPKEGD